MSTFTRPGISAGYLSGNGIREIFQAEAHALCGIEVRGIYIPYFDLEHPRAPLIDKGKVFGRLRRHQPGKGGKYHQEAGTVVHSYASLGWQGHGGETLAIVEGEFKSLSLTDPSHDYVLPALGIPGFFGFARRIDPDSDEFELTSELAKAIERFEPKKILFVGDNDTVLNQQFAVAARRLAELLPEIEVRVVQIPLDHPKGVDDCRAKLQKKFQGFFEDLIEASPIITGETDSDAFSLERLESQIPIIYKFQGAESTACTEKLIKLGAQLSEAARQELYSIVKGLGLGKTEFAKAVSKKKQQLTRDNLSSHEDRIHRKIQGYYSAGKSYFRQVTSGDFQELQRVDVLLHLDQELEFSPAEASRALYLIQRDKQIDYAGPLAGFPAGRIDQNSRKILVTRGPKIIEARQGSAPLIDKMLEEFFGKGVDPEWKTQADIFYGYLLRGRAALENPDIHLPGQALGLVGAADAGKNLVAEHLLTPFYGGRQADLSDYLLGGKFNAGLLGAEHLIVSDSAVPQDEEKRQLVRSRIKQLVANEIQPYHRKFGEQIDLRPIHRITILANGDRHGLSIFPELESSVRDKLVILKCYRPTGLPGNESERREFLETLVAELPAFISRISRFSLDDAYVDGRFGVGHYCHSDVARDLRAEDPTKAFSTVLNMALETQSLSGTAEACFQHLVRKLADSFSGVVSSPSEFGRMLHSLMTHDPAWSQRISKSRVLASNRNYKNLWTLKSTSSGGAPLLVLQ